MFATINKSTVTPVERLTRFFATSDIDIKNFELDAKIPARTISHAVEGYQALPPKHVDNIVAQLKKVATKRQKEAQKINKLIAAL